MKILDKVKMLVAGLAVAALGIAVAAPAPVMAAPDGKVDYYFTSVGGTKSDTLISKVKNAVNVIIGLIGIVAVVMIIFGGFQYATSAGDTSKVTKAKNTVVYGVVGLVVAVLAFAIVNFVINNVLN